jgi:hypothetical protein
MPRFSIKRLLFAMTLIAVGMGLIYFAYHHPNLDGTETLQLAGGFFGGTALIGAGILAPFRRPWTGAIVAVVLVCDIAASTAV